MRRGTMEENRRSKLGTIFYIGILPLIFTIVLVAFLLKFMGFPVGDTLKEWGNRVPIMNQLIADPTPVEAENTDDSDEWKKMYLKSETTVKEMNQKISNLKKDLNSNQKSLEDQKKINDVLQKQLKEKQAQKTQEQLKQVAGIYENMSASKAAAIFEAMPLEEASLTIMMLDQDHQSSILGGMKDPKRAAQITMLIKEISTLNETDSTALTEQVHELALKQENPSETLSETIAGMPAAQSAIIIQSMMGTNSIVAMDLMKKINNSTRGQILTEIAKVDAKLAAKITADLNN
jgi:flagellar motility protein MotE (MotC chaperone)